MCLHTRETPLTSLACDPEQLFPVDEPLRRYRARPSRGNSLPIQTAANLESPIILVLGTTFLGLAFTSVTLYALLASEIRRVVKHPGLSRAVNRVGAGTLINAGVLTAVMRRA